MFCCAELCDIWMINSGLSSEVCEDEMAGIRFDSSARYPDHTCV